MRGIWLLLGLLRYPYNRNNSMVLTLRQMWSPGRYMGSLFSKTKRESGSINRDCMQSSFWVLEFVVSYVPGNKNRTIVNHVSSPENIVIIGFSSEGKILIYCFQQRDFNRKIYTWTGCLVGVICGVFIVRHCLTLKSFCKESDCRILMMEFFVKFREEFTHISI